MCRPRRFVLMLLWDRPERVGEVDPECGWGRPRAV